MRNVFALLILLFATNASLAEGLPRSSPEAQGISSAALLKFIEAADKIDAMNSIMLVRHGKVVAEGWWAPYAAPEPHMLYSLSKSFTSTAVGLAIAEGKLSLDDTVLSFFPDVAPAKPSDNLKAMRIRDLLSMSTGHHEEDIQGFSFTATDEPLTKKFLAMPVAHKPGTHFVYNTPATYMCSAIVQKVTGQNVLDYLQPRLFKPLGIEGPTWSESPQGISHGGFGLSIRTEDIGQFGQLYLQKGKWQGEQLIPESWVAAATSRQVSNGSNPESDWEQGYGYQFWRCRHGFYRGDGAFGQFCIVMPEYDAVLAITSGVRDMQAVMSLAWDQLVPAMQSEPLPADESAQAALVEKLAKLELKQPQASAASPLAKELSGKVYRLSDDPKQINWVKFEFGDTSSTVVIGMTSGERRVVCGHGNWEKGRADWIMGPDARSALPADQPIAASGGWTTDDTYVARVCLYQTPYYVDVKFCFAGDTVTADTVTIDTEYNVAFKDRKQPQLIGKLE